MIDYKVSIIVPYYNSESYLERLINSVKGQSHPNFECILVDDGSRDDSFALAGALTADDARFQNVKRPDQYRAGGRGAKNYGFTLSTGSFIVFFDSDDLMYDNHIAARLDYLISDPAKDAVVSDFGWRVLEGKPKRIYRYNPAIFDGFVINVKEDWFWLNYMDLRFWFNPGNPMWRRRSIEDKPMWDETTSIGEDHEYHARLMLQGLDIGHLKMVTWDYMANETSMISTSEAIRPLLSRSYGKTLVTRSLIQFLGFRQSLVRKDLTWQMKILRRVVACPVADPERSQAIEIMLKRVGHVMEILGYGAFRRKTVLGLLRLTAFIHGRTGKLYSAYHWIIRDRNATNENDYFTIS
jgi:glycosyltransferase involved in cell wall biosynthesis